jgi:hypothetical protein
MKRKATDDLEDICRGMKKIKLEKDGRIRCDICDGVYLEEECIDYLCMDCYYDCVEDFEEELQEIIYTEMNYTENNKE